MYKYNFRKQALLASTLLFAGLPALASEGSKSGAVVAAAPHANVNCPGITSVPMTSDAGQSLPLRVVGTLSCGQPITILSDNEGYTADVRTADGKEGYIARMYITMNDAANAAAAEGSAPSATPVNNVVRWQAAAPGCEQFSIKGYTVESARANGMTVQVSLQDSGWKLRATIAISNEAGEVVEVLPSLITLDELQPGLKTLPSQDPTKLAHVKNHEVLWTALNAQPPASAHLSEAHVTNVSFHASSPNYFIEQTVPVAAKSHDDSAVASAELKTMALKQINLSAGQKTTGVIWFQRDANARELSLRVPVGDLVFDFPLSFSQKK
jgi:hypothetical protein